MTRNIYAITGITGKVGGALARTLLAGGRSVRAVVRDAGKGRSWAEKGCEVALAEMEDAATLAAAFKEVDGVFVLPPSEFDPAPGFPEARAVINAVKTALEATRPRKVVCLSTIGAQATKPNLLTQRTLMEQELRGLTIPVTFLRPAWFMENFALDVASARDSGVTHERTGCPSRWRTGMATLLSSWKPLIASLRMKSPPPLPESWATPSESK